MLDLILDKKMMGDEMEKLKVRDAPSFDWHGMITEESGISLCEHRNAKRFRETDWS